jgi:hypothetical protein
MCSKNIKGMISQDQLTQDKQRIGLEILKGERNYSFKLRGDRGNRLYLRNTGLNTYTIDEISVHASS